MTKEQKAIAWFLCWLIGWASLLEGFLRVITFNILETNIRLKATIFYAKYVLTAKGYVIND